jgi:hypothetical protein
LIRGFMINFFRIIRAEYVVPSVRLLLSLNPIFCLRKIYVDSDSHAKRRTPRLDGGSNSPEQVVQPQYPSLSKESPAFVFHRIRVLHWVDS